MKNPQSWALVGIPDQEGVMNVGGRLGASQGPLSFRRMLRRMKGRDGVLEKLQDLGDISPVSDVEANHRLAADRIAHACSGYNLTVVVGGGHDHGYSHLLGLSKRYSRIGCLNIDAHLDVRRPDPAITSGSPFYLALESGILEPKRFVEFGIQRHCNGPELWQYVESKKIRVIPYDGLRFGDAIPAFRKQLKYLASSCEAVAISLDLDAAAECHAPGVSAPQSEGFSSAEIVAMMEYAGSEKKVVSLGIFELNPIHDLDDRTARLAATSAYHFVAASLAKP